MNKMEFSVDALAFSYVAHMSMNGGLKNPVDKDKLLKLFVAIETIKNESPEMGEAQFEDVIDFLIEKYCD